MKQIKGLIFDLDGTLTLTQQFHYQAFSQIFKKYGITYSEEDDKYKYAGTGSKYIFPSVFAVNRITISSEEVAKYEAEKKIIYDQLVENNPIQAVTGAKAFLEKVKNYGLQTIVATGNKLEAAGKILNKAGLGEYFQQIVCQKDVVKQKPAPDIFLFAANKLQLDPSECIVFEDAINGVKAASAGNIRCIALATSIPKEDLLKAGAEKVINDYNEFTESTLKNIFNI